MCYNLLQGSPNISLVIRTALSLSAEVKGIELEGKISRGTLICPFKLKISADGQSFEGTLAAWGNLIESLKGKRKK